VPRRAAHDEQVAAIGESDAQLEVGASAPAPEPKPRAAPKLTESISVPKPRLSSMPADAYVPVPYGKHRADAVEGRTAAA